MKKLKELADKIAAEHGLEWYQPLNKAEDSAGMTAIDLGNGYSLHHEHSENGHDIWSVGCNGERAGTFMLRTEDTRRNKPMVVWAGLEKAHRGKGVGTLAYKALAVHYGGIDSDKASSSDDAIKAWVRAGGRQMKLKTQFGKPRYTLDGDKKNPPIVWNEDLEKNNFSTNTIIQKLQNTPNRLDFEQTLRNVKNNKEDANILLNYVDEHNKKRGPYFHGTPKYKEIKQNGFKNTTGMRSGFMGAMEEVENQGNFLTNSLNVAHFFGKNRAENNDYEVLSVIPDVQKTLDLTSEKAPSSIIKHARTILREWDGIDNSRKRTLNRNDIWWLLDKPKFVNYLKDLGYDSVKFKEEKDVLKLADAQHENDTHTLFVINPEKLKIHKKINTIDDLYNHFHQNTSIQKSYNPSHSLHLINKFEGSDFAPTEFHYSVKSNGKEIGRAIVFDKDPRSIHQAGKTGPSLKDIRLHPDHQGQGHSQGIINKLVETHGPLASDSRGNISPAGAKMFQKYGTKQLDNSYILHGQSLKKSIENLIKAPIMNEGNAWQEPVRTSLRDFDIEEIKEGVSHNHTIKTFNLPNNLYHHVITHNNDFAEHIISDNEDPFANGITRVAGNINQNGHLIIGSSQTEPYYQNKGYGKLAYTQALNYHGGLISDVDLSHTANSIWKHLKTLPNVDVKFGKRGTSQRHLATLKKSSNIDSLIQQAKARLEGVKKVGSQEPRPMIFASKDKKKHAFVTVDPSKKGQWRVTHFIDSKPAGHSEAPTFSHAIKVAHESGYNVFKEIPEEELFKAESLQKDKKPINQFAGGTYEKVLHEGDGFKVVSNYRHNNIYHGSPSPINEFSVSKGSGQFGTGLYLAHDEETGRFHAQGQRQGVAGQRPKSEGHVYQGSFHAPIAVLITDDDEFGKHALDDDNVAEAYRDYGDHLHPRVTKHWGNFVNENYGANAIVFNPSEKNVLTPFTQTLAMNGSKIKMNRLGKSESFVKAESLIKAAHPSDLRRITNKTNPKAQEIVDAAPHAVHAPDQAYVDFLNHPQAQKGLGKRDVGGISAKMVHKVGDDTYMAKPYHKRIESATKAMNPHPISGWSTMATRNIFHSAGIGHLCEDVAFHEHNGVPMTVHKFAKDVSDSSDLRYMKSADKSLVGPAIEADAKKIAIMDFLTNNLDRHGGNVMVRSNDSGAHGLLAIDHERGFQYNQPAGLRYMGNPPETPRAYLRHTGLKDAVSTPSWMDDEEASYMPEGHTTKDWWKANRDSIVNSFNKDIESIKDPHLKKHIHTNFIRRVNWLDEFSHPDHFSFFSQHNNPTPVEMFKERRPKTDYKAIMKNLPENPYKAIGVIDGLFSKKLSFATRETLADLWDEQVDKMSGEEIGNYLKDIQKTKNHPHPKGAYWSLMNRLAQENHRQGMQHLVQNNMIDLPYWKNIFEARLKLGGVKQP